MVRRVRAAGALVLAAAAIAVAATTGALASQTTDGSGLTVALVLPGTLGDKGFLDSSAAGVQRMKRELGASTKIIQANPSDPGEWLRNLQAAAGHYDLVITGGSDMKDNLTKVAKANPKQKFLYFDDIVNAPNVANIVYKQNDGSFLAGVLAAQVTTDTKHFRLSKGGKVVGFVGGMDIPVIHDFLVGFKAGVKFVDPKVKVLVSYAGSWSDPQKGFTLTMAMYGNGADIAYNVAGGTGLGVLKASAKANKYSIGVDANQNGLYPGHVLASMLKRVDNSIFDLAKLYQQRKLKTGKTYVYGLKNDGVGLVIDTKDVPASVRRKLDQAAQKVKSGAITVPSAFKQ